MRVRLGLGLLFEARFAGGPIKTGEATRHDRESGCGFAGLFGVCCL